MSEFRPYAPSPNIKSTPLEYFSPFVAERKQIAPFPIHNARVYVEINALDFSNSPSPVDRTRETNSMIVAFEDSGNVAGFVLGKFAQNNETRTLKITDMENLDSRNAPGVVRTLLIHLISTGAVSEIIIPRERSGHAEKMMRELMERSASGQIPIEITPPREGSGDYIIRGK